MVWVRELSQNWRVQREKAWSVNSECTWRHIVCTWRHIQVYTVRKRERNQFTFSLKNERPASHIDISSSEVRIQSWITIEEIRWNNFPSNEIPSHDIVFNGNFGGQSGICTMFINPSFCFCQLGISIKISQDIQVFGENWFEHFLALNGTIFHHFFFRDSKHEENYGERAADLDLSFG